MITKQDLPQIITSKKTAARFVDWLKRHPEVTNISGYRLQRIDEEPGLIVVFGQTEKALWPGFVYNYRKMFNANLRLWLAIFARKE